MSNKENLTINGKEVIKINNKNKMEFLLMNGIKPLKVQIGENGYTLEGFFEKGENTKKIVQAFNSVKAGKSYEFNYRKYLEAQYEIGRLIQEAKKERRNNQSQKSNYAKPKRTDSSGNNKR